VKGLFDRPTVPARVAALKQRVALPAFCDTSPVGWSAIPAGVDLRCT